MDEDRRLAGDAVGDDVEFETDGGGKTPDKVDAAGGAHVETTLHKLALLRYDFSNRELYWKLVLPLLNPAPPQLHDTDGDPLSMQRLIFAINLVENDGQVIVDECHHVGAVFFNAIFRRTKAKYVLGPTATPIRRDGQQPIIFMQ